MLDNFLYGFVSCHTAYCLDWWCLNCTSCLHPIVFHFGTQQCHFPSALEGCTFLLYVHCMDFSLLPYIYRIDTKRARERAEDKDREIMASQHHSDLAQLADIFKRLKAKVLGYAGTAVRGAVLLLTVEACKEREQGPLPWVWFYELRECTARAMSAYLEKKRSQKE